MKNAISWFEIPTTDLDRAQKFYEAIFDFKMFPLEFPNFYMRLFPIEDPQNQIGGALVSTQPGFYHSSESHGTLIYLNANPDLNTVLERVSAAGGKVLFEKTKVSDDYGFIGVFIDSEGNRIGLHSIE
ncbi:MAG: VOC family protein [Saprospiraceae bacterium]|nr:VOC family protein [Saprospiraceae bacterium]